MQQTANEPLRLSYTALDMLDHCPLQYYLKYAAKLRPEKEETLALELGTLLHKVRELCSKALIAGRKPDYTTLAQTLYEGWTGKEKATDEPETILGVEALRKKYFLEWITEEPGIPNYDERIRIFFNHLPEEEQDEAWQPVLSEAPFEFAFREGVHLIGVIDKIERNVETGAYRIVDYKSSKKPYDQRKLAAPLQMAVYALAFPHVMAVATGKPFEPSMPSEFLYDFVALGEKRRVVAPGWLTKALSHLQKLVDSIAQRKSTGVWDPKPSPLCHWCSYCATNPQADGALKSICPYHALWTPDYKTRQTRQLWPGGIEAAEIVARSQADQFIL